MSSPLGSTAVASRKIGADAAARPGRVVGDQVGRRQVVVDEARLVRGRDDAVGQRHRAEVDGREELHGATLRRRRAGRRQRRLGGRRSDAASADSDAYRKLGAEIGTASAVTFSPQPRSSAPGTAARAAARRGRRSRPSRRRRPLDRGRGRAPARAPRSPRGRRTAPGGPRRRLHARQAGTSFSAHAGPPLRRGTTCSNVRSRSPRRERAPAPDALRRRRARGWRARRSRAREVGRDPAARAATPIPSSTHSSPRRPSVRRSTRPPAVERKTALSSSVPGRSTICTSVRLAVGSVPGRARRPGRLGGGVQRLALPAAVLRRGPRRGRG